MGINVKNNRNKSMELKIQGNLQCAAPHSFILHLNFKLTNSSVFHLFTVEIIKNNMNNCKKIGINV